MGGIGQRVDGAPAFAGGEEVVVFLNRAEAGGYRVAGLAQGKFSVAGMNATPDLVADRAWSPTRSGPASGAPRACASPSSSGGPERAMNRRQRPSPQPILLVMSGGAYAFVRETTVRGDPAAGKCLYWGSADRPLQGERHQRRGPAAAPGLPRPAPRARTRGAAVTLIAATLPTWNGATQSGGAQACTDFNLQNDGTTTQARRSATTGRT